jgi:uroporphyrinogen-III decarboxylase
MLQYGSEREIKNYCKKPIDIIGKDGGFILSPRSVTDEVKPANLKAMIDFTKEYGWY